VNVSAKVLEQLKKKTTRATFDTWLADTTGHQTKEALTIYVHSTFAKDWIQSRLSGQIKRTVQEITGRALDIKFVIRSTTDPPSPMIIQLVEYDPTKKGFVQVSNYSIEFWQPYLGQKAFRLWLTIRSFAYTAGKSTWPSITTLAHICFRGNRQQITGRSSQGKYYPGTLESLEREKVVWYKRNTNYYIFRVLNSLPLLTPTQLDTLSIPLQERHRRFLKRCQLDYEEWDQLALPTLGDVT